MLKGHNGSWARFLLGTECIRGMGHSPSGRRCLVAMYPAKTTFTASAGVPSFPLTHHSRLEPAWAFSHRAHIVGKDDLCSEQERPSVRLRVSRTPKCTSSAVMDSSLPSGTVPYRPPSIHRNRGFSTSLAWLAPGETRPVHAAERGRYNDVDHAWR